MRIIEVPQQTADWFQMRVGKVTGSRIVDVTSFLKNGKSSSAREKYKAQLVCEILTQEPMMDGYLSPAMMHGNDTEPFARADYELRTDSEVDLTGFVDHPTLPRSGGSPDGLVGESGIIEIKCPNTTTHIGWMLDGRVPEEHEPQMMFYLAVTGRQWADFISFDPRLPERYRTFIKRLDRDENRIADIEDAVRKFNDEVDEVIARLNSLNPEIVREEPAPEDFGELGLTDEDLAMLDKPSAE